MLNELARVFICLAVGEILNRTGMLPFPAPVIGLIALYVNLLFKRELPEQLGRIADGVLSVLGMLFVPAGVGVLAYANLLRTEFIPIVAAVVGGTLVTFAATVLAANQIAGLHRRSARSTKAANASG